MSVLLSSDPSQGASGASHSLLSVRSDFAWSLAYHHHPGFENNEGGYGTLTWDLRNDSITLNHADRYVECSHSYDEGL